MENNGNLIRNHDQMPPQSFSQPPQPLFSQTPQTLFSQPPQPSYSLPPPLPYAQQIRNFWCNQIESMVNLKQHPFPIARMKRIMKCEPNVQMVSAEAPIVLAKACEIFITDLTMRSWFHASQKNRHTLQKSDMSAAVADTPDFDFLIDIVPREETATAADPGFAAMPNPDGVGVPYYYHPSGMVAGSPVGDNSGPVDGDETAEESEGSGDLY